MAQGELNITSSKTSAAEKERAREIQAWVFRRVLNEEHYDPLWEELHPEDFE